MFVSFQQSIISCPILYVIICARIVQHCLHSELITEAVSLRDVSRGAAVFSGVCLMVVASW
jgi:hypothetical protein